MTRKLLFGDLRTGAITDVLDATSASWAQQHNDAGSVDSVTVGGREVAAKQLRVTAQTARTFLAVDVDGVLQEAGPVWSRTWDDSARRATFGAAGLWSLFDHRKVIPVLTAAQRVQTARLQVTATTLGGIARRLVQVATEHAGGSLPLVLPPTEAGTRTETFHGWQLLDVGDQLRQLTQRDTNPPDIRFRPRYTATRTHIEWVMETGTEAVPALTQVGEDWYFDTTVRDSPVLGIDTDEDGTVMGHRAWVTGSGQEQDTIIGTADDPTLPAAGWPLLEVEELRSSVLVQATVDGHAVNLRDRSARPVEVWKVRVRGDAARDVLAGHTARLVIPRGHEWLPAGETRMKIKTKSGDLADPVTLDMYPIASQVAL